MARCPKKTIYKDLNEPWCYDDGNGVLKTGSHIIEADDDGSLIVEQWLDQDGVEIDPDSVQECPCPEGCPEPLPLIEKENCDGTKSMVNANPVVIEGIVKVKSCGTDDYELLCKKDGTGQVLGWGDPDTRSLILTELDGTPFAGTYDDVEACSTQLESDDIPWCVDGIDYNQHIVKSEGAPTGSTFWTDGDGAVITDPRADATKVYKGECSLCVNEPAIGVITDLSLLNQ